jgi:hypothetical protein
MGASAQPDTGIYNEVNAFKSFNVAFPGLVGRDSMLSDQDMTDFTTFILNVSYPPNPVRNLDNSLTASQQAGKDFYFRTLPDGSQFPSDRFHNCNGCHTLDPAGNAATSKHPGFFGTDGKLTFENEPQIFKIPHLRNIYTKVGMFGMPAAGFFGPGNNGELGDQVRGFGLLHDGSVDTPFRFVSARVFDDSDGRIGFTGADPVAQRRDMEEWLLAFDSDLAPVVGQQVTLARANATAATARLELLRARATAPFASQIVGPGVKECDLVAQAVVRGVAMGWLYRPASASWEPDDGGPALSSRALTVLATGGDEAAVTFTCVPPGSGVRVALDRDSDGIVNRRDRCADDPGC